MTADLERNEFSGRLISVKIEVPNHPLAELTMPKENWIGTLILARCIDHALANAGIITRSSLSSGALNGSIILSFVSDLALGLRLIKGEMEKLCFLQFCQIDYFDSAEAVWRTVHPNSRNDFDPLREIHERGNEIKSLAERFTNLREARDQ